MLVGNRSLPSPTPASLNLVPPTPGITRRPSGPWPSTPGTPSSHLALTTAVSSSATGWCTSECQRPRLPAPLGDGSTHVLSLSFPHSDLLQNPLLVPVKVLKGHALTRDLGVLDVAFHPTQPWVFSSGADGTLRLFT